MDLKTCLYVGFALYTIFVIYVGFIGSKKMAMSQQTVDF